DGSPLQRGQQDTAQGIAEREAEAALQRLGHHQGMSLAIRAGIDGELVRLDQLGPILLDNRTGSHGFPTSLAASKRRRRSPAGEPGDRDRIHSALSPAAWPAAPGSAIRPGGAWAAGNRYAESASHP